MSDLVSHTEQVVIARPLPVVLAAAKSTSLKDEIDAKSKLPGVAGTRMLTPGEFGRPGSRRLTCLTDGSTLVEQVLVNSERPSRAEFSYIVWNYSTAQARPVLYGVGRFERAQLPGGRTLVRWTYGFRLRRDRFPGLLGWFGDYLFRTRFLEREYSDMMKATLATAKRRLERTS